MLKRPAGFCILPPLREQLFESGSDNLPRKQLVTQEISRIGIRADKTKNSSLAKEG